MEPIAANIKTAQPLQQLPSLPTLSPAQLPQTPSLPTLQKIPELPKLPGFSHVNSQNKQILAQREYAARQQAYTDLYADTESTTQVNSLLDAVVKDIQTAVSGDYDLVSWFEAAKDRFEERKDRVNLFHLIREARKSPYTNVGDAFKAYALNNLNAFGENLDVLVYPVKGLVGWAVAQGGGDIVDANGLDLKKAGVWKSMGAGWGIGTGGKRYDLNYDFKLKWANGKNAALPNWALNMLAETVSDPVNIIEWITGVGVIDLIFGVAGTAAKSVANAASDTALGILKNVMKAASNGDDVALKAMAKAYGKRLAKAFIKQDKDEAGKILADVFTKTFDTVKKSQFSTIDDFVAYFEKEFPNLVSEAKTFGKLRGIINDDAQVYQEFFKHLTEDKNFMDNMTEQFWKYMSQQYTVGTTINVISGVSKLEQMKRMSKINDIAEGVDRAMLFAANPLVGGLITGARTGIEHLKPIQRVIGFITNMVSRTSEDYKVTIGGKNAGINVVHMDDITAKIEAQAKALAANPKVPKASIDKARKDCADAMMSSIVFQLRAMYDSVLAKGLVDLNPSAIKDDLNAIVIECTQGTFTSCKQYFKHIDKLVKHNQILAQYYGNTPHVLDMLNILDAAIKDSETLGNSARYISDAEKYINVLQDADMLYRIQAKVKDSKGIRVIEAPRYRFKDMLKGIFKDDPKLLSAYKGRSAALARIYDLIKTGITKKSIGDFLADLTDVRETFKAIEGTDLAKQIDIRYFNTIVSAIESKEFAMSVKDLADTDDVSGILNAALFRANSEQINSAVDSALTSINSYEGSVKHIAGSGTLRKSIAAFNAITDGLQKNLDRGALTPKMEVEYSEALADVIEKFNAVKKPLTDAAEKIKKTAAYESKLVEYINGKCGLNELGEAFSKSVHTSFSTISDTLPENMRLRDIFNSIDIEYLKKNAAGAHQSFRDWSFEYQFSRGDLDDPQVLYSVFDLFGFDYSKYREDAGTVIYPELKTFIEEEVYPLLTGDRSLEKSLKDLKYNLDEMSIGKFEGIIEDLRCCKDRILTSIDEKIHSYGVNDLEPSDSDYTNIADVFKDFRKSVNDFFSPLITALNYNEYVFVNNRAWVEYGKEHSLALASLLFSDAFNTLDDIDEAIPALKIFNDSVEKDIAACETIQDEIVSGANTTDTLESIAGRLSENEQLRRYLSAIERTKNLVVMHRLLYTKSAKTFGDQGTAVWNAFIETMQGFARQDLEMLTSETKKRSFIQKMQTLLDSSMKTHSYSLEWYNSVLRSSDGQDDVYAIWESLFDDKNAAAAAFKQLEFEEHINPNLDLLLTRFALKYEDPKEYERLMSLGANFFDIESSYKSAVLGRNTLYNGKGTTNNYSGMCSQISRYDPKSGTFTLYRLNNVNYESKGYVGDKAPKTVLFDNEHDLLLTYFNDIEESDIECVVGHNSTWFDIGFLRSRWKQVRELDDPLWDQFKFKMLCENTASGHIDTMNAIRAKNHVPIITDFDQITIEQLIDEYYDNMVTCGANSILDLDINEAIDSIQGIIDHLAHIEYGKRDVMLINDLQNLKSELNSARKNSTIFLKSEQQGRRLVADITREGAFTEHTEYAEGGFKDTYNNMDQLTDIMRRLKLCKDDETAVDLMRADGVPNSDYAQDQWWRKHFVYAIWYEQALKKPDKTLFSYDEWEHEFYNGADITSFNDILNPKGKAPKDLLNSKLAFIQNNKVVPHYNRDGSNSRYFVDTYATAQRGLVMQELYHVESNVDKLCKQTIKHVTGFEPLTNADGTFNRELVKTILQNLHNDVLLGNLSDVPNLQWAARLDITKLDTLSDEELFALYWIAGKTNIPDTLPIERQEVLQNKSWYISGINRDRIAKSVFQPDNSNRAKIRIGLLDRSLYGAVYNSQENMLLDLDDVIQDFNNINERIDAFQRVFEQLPQGGAKQYARQNMRHNFDGFIKKVKRNINDPVYFRGFANDMELVSQQVARARLGKFLLGVVPDTVKADIDVNYLVSELCFNNYPIIRLTATGGDNAYAKYARRVQKMLEINAPDLEAKGIIVEKDNGSILIGIKRGCIPSIDFDAGKVSLNGVEYHRVEQPYAGIKFDPAFSVLTREDVNALDEAMKFTCMHSGYNGYGYAATVDNYTKYLPPVFDSRERPVLTEQEIKASHMFKNNIKFNGGEYNSWDYEGSTTFFRNFCEAYSYALNAMNFEDLFIDSLFGTQNDMLLHKAGPNGKIGQGVFSGCTYADVADVFSKRDDIVPIRLVEDGSIQGYHIIRLELSSEGAVRNALESSDNTIAIVPYNVYSASCEEVNNMLTEYRSINGVHAAEMSNEEVTATLKHRPKFWLKYLISIYKLGYLGLDPATWARNFIDSNSKAAADTGEAIGTFNKYFRGGNILANSEVLSQSIIQLWNTMSDESSAKPYLRELVNDPDRLKFVTDQMTSILNSANKQSVEYRVVQNIYKSQKIFNDAAAVEYLLHMWSGGRLIFNEKNIHDFYTFCAKAKIDVALPEQDYKMVRSFIADGASAGETKAIERYMQAVYSGKINTKAPNLSDIDDVSFSMDKLLSPMGKIEQCARFGQYLTLSEQGYLRSEIFQRLSKTHFDYNNKSAADKIIELIIPFWTFRKLNTLYWLDAFDNAPMLAKMVADAYEAAELAWDVEPDDLRVNKALQYHVNAGNLPITDNFVLKVNPSYMDAMNMLFNPIDTVFESVWAPLKNIGIGIYEGALAAHAHDSNEGFLNTFADYVKDWSSVPFAGKILQTYIGKNSTGGKTRQRMSIKEQPVQYLIGTLFPGMFGSVVRYEKYKSTHRYTTTYRTSPYMYQNRRYYYPTRRINVYYPPRRPRTHLSRAYNEFYRKTKTIGFRGFLPQQYRSEFI